MGIFSWNKKKEKLMLVFDIGSSSVGGAFFLTEKSGIPKIIFSVREPIVLENSLDINNFLSSTIKSLEIVVGKMYKASLGKPDAIFCVLSSPWHVSQTRVIRFEKNTPFVFTSKLADSLIQNEIALFEEEYKKIYTDVRTPVRSIEFKNIKTMLNGYETAHPLNQKAKELEMTIFVSIGGEQVLKKIEESIRALFHFKEMKFSSFALASFAVVRDVYEHTDNFLLIDVGGEVTDIVMAKKNTLRESTSFPIGCNSIIRGIASTLKVPLEEAASLFSLLQDGHATASVAKKAGVVIDQLKADWLHKFQESLANLSHDISIPSTIYITVDKAMITFFTEIIKAEQFNQYTLTESKFEVIFLGAEVFQGMALFKDNALRDPSLIIDSVYINRFLNNSTKAVEA